MSHKWMFGIAIALIALGAIGIAVVTAMPGLFPASRTGVASASLGRQIYELGSDASGPIPRAIPGGGLSGLGMMASGCADCHGPDGRGGRIGMMMFGVVDVPDIRYSTLTAPHSDQGTTTPGWTDAEIARAIIDGTDPAGQPLATPMPRWAMTRQDVDAVIAYLKELSAR